MNNKTAWVMGRVKGKMLPCRRTIPSVYAEKERVKNVLNRLTELSETEKERIDAQVLDRALYGLKSEIFWSRKAQQAIQERKGLSLGKQFLIFLLVMFTAFVLAITIGALVRANKLRPMPANRGDYKLIEQRPL